MSRLADAIKIVIVCAIVAYAYRHFMPNISPKRNRNHVPSSKPGLLAAPKRKLKNIYSSSVAIQAHNAVINAMAQDFAESVERENPKWENILHIGDAYARGKFPFLRPNENMARMCYRVTETCPSSSAAATARSRILETNTNPVEVGDQKGVEMSTQYGNYACKAAVKYISEKKPSQQHVSLKIRARPPPIPRTPIQPTATRVADAHVTADIRPQNTATPQAPRRQAGRRRRRPRDIGGGAQNTHDHGVVTAMKMNIKQLKEEHGAKLFREHSRVVDETMALCRNVVDDPDSSGVSEETFHDVYDVATSLTKDTFSDTGLTQIQVLDLALEKIKSLDEHTSKGVTETLCKRMSTGIEDGKTVCATGKLARIVSVFEGVLEDTQKAVSIAYVEKEIAQMAIKVRDEFLDKVGPVGKTAYESAQSVPEYGTSMGKILRERVQDEYVTKLNMSPTIIDPLVELYSGSF